MTGLSYSLPKTASGQILYDICDILIHINMNWQNTMYNMFYSKGKVYAQCLVMMATQRIRHFSLALDYD